MTKRLSVIALLGVLSVRPGMAQNPPAPNLKVNPNGGHFDNTLVGPSILTALPTRFVSTWISTALRS